MLVFFPMSHCRTQNLLWNSQEIDILNKAIQRIRMTKEFWESLDSYCTTLHSIPLLLPRLSFRKGERGINWEIRSDIYTLLYIKQITNKDLLYSTGNSTQYSAMTYVEKESKKEQIYVNICITYLLCCIPETNNIVNQLCSNKNF